MCTYTYLCCLKADISAPDLHTGSLNGTKGFVLYKALHPSMGLPKEAEEGLPVVLPEGLQLLGWGELAAAQFQRHLHAAVPNVVVVLADHHLVLTIRPGLWRKRYKIKD